MEKQLHIGLLAPGWIHSEVWRVLREHYHDGDIVGFVRDCRDQHGLKIDGLMCLPPVGDAAGPHFALLAKLATSLDLTCLSMGMSADYAAAVSLGATHVRLGTAIFGPRG